MIIAYKGPWLIYFVYLLVRCIKKVSLPNIITGMDIVPELIQHKFSVDNVAYEKEKLLYDIEYRENFIRQLSAVKERLSDKYSAEEVANCILSFLS